MSGTAGLTGWTGFIGKRVHRALVKAGFDVVTIGRGDSSRQWSPPDVTDVDLHGIDVLLHLASFIPPSHDPDHADRCVAVNALGTLSLLETARRDGVAHVVHTSSGNVYADPATSSDEHSAAFPDRLAPYYLGSKLLADVWVSHAGRTGLGTTIIRPSAVYGPGMGGGVVRIFVDRLLTGKPVTLSDGGRFRSDLVYVDDVVRAMVNAAQAPPGGIVNVGSGSATSIGELADTLVDLLQLPPSMVVREDAATGPAPGFAPLVIDRLSQLVHRSPTPLREGLKRMLDEERPQ